MATEVRSCLDAAHVIRSKFTRLRQMSCMVVCACVNSTVGTLQGVGGGVPDTQQPWSRKSTTTSLANMARHDHAGLCDCYTWGVPKCPCRPPVRGQRFHKGGGGMCLPRVARLTVHVCTSRPMADVLMSKFYQQVSAVTGEKASHSVLALPIPF